MVQLWVHRFSICSTIVHTNYMHITCKEKQIMPESFMPPHRTLMGPGPSDVPERVLAALARPTIGHLDPAFISMMDELKGLLQYALQTKIGRASCRERV